MKKGAKPSIFESKSSISDHDYGGPGSNPANELMIKQEPHDPLEVDQICIKSEPIEPFNVNLEPIIVLNIKKENIEANIELEEKPPSVQKRKICSDNEVVMPPAPPPKKILRATGEEIQMPPAPPPIYIPNPSFLSKFVAKDLSREVKEIPPSAAPIMTENPVKFDKIYICPLCDGGKNPAQFGSLHGAQSHMWTFHRIPKKAQQRLEEAGILITTKDTNVK